ncbi:hypothetical protein QBC47DRAFT_402274 [Echria macrotheca]|uniref:Extracellular matrix protein n=1 Tax=Echria macrotheca TaxID=438768 RepID=A0AAJ0BD82_9PEZI|nr:hypothetical protein QBC47DRAFT_402274 [Echria macrotheca]
MKLSTLLFGALAAIAAAAPAFTNTEFDVQEGKPFTLTWIGTTDPVTIEILTGPNKDSLNPIKTIATGVSGSSFTYTPTGLPSGNYAFRITDTATKEQNYSVLFPYVGTAVSSSIVSSTRSAVSSTVTSASSTTESSSASTSASTTNHASSTSTSATSTRTNSPSTTPANNNEGQRFASPLALVFITVAALVFFN